MPPPVKQTDEFQFTTNHRRSHRTGWGGPRPPQLLGLEHWTPPTFGILTWDPLWDPPMGLWMGPPQNFWTPLWDPARWDPPKFLTKKIKNRAGKLHQLPPPRIHEIGPENSINYPPPRIHEPHRLPPPSKSIWTPPTFEAWRRPCYQPTHNIFNTMTLFFINSYFNADSDKQS